MKKSSNILIWIWAYSLLAEAYFWQFLGNIVNSEKLKVFMIARSFRLAVAWANLLTEGTMFPIDGR